MVIDGTANDGIDGQWLLSSDSHVIEPPDLWAGRGGALADRMPHVVSADDGPRASAVAQMIVICLATDH